MHLGGLWMLVRGRVADIGTVTAIRTFLKSLREK